MKKWIVYASAFLLFATVVSTRTSAVQGGGGPQPWSKTCTLSGVGADGCTVTVTMTADTTNSCEDNGYAYCVTVAVSCPSGGGEVDCSSSNECGICGSGASGVTVPCDGQTFSAQPKNSHDWNDVASDCGDLTCRVS
jgi:hypothetical protein